MALPTSGPISLDDVNVELGDPSGTVISLGDADVRALAGVPSGSISLQDLYGKSNFPDASNDLTIATNILGVGYFNTLGDLVPDTVSGKTLTALSVDNGSNIFIQGSGFDIRTFFKLKFDPNSGFPEYEIPYSSSSAFQINLGDGDALYDWLNAQVGDTIPIAASIEDIPKILESSITITQDNSIWNGYNQSQGFGTIAQSSITIAGGTYTITRLDILNSEVYLRVEGAGANTLVKSDLKLLEFPNDSEVYDLDNSTFTTPTSTAAQWVFTDSSKPIWTNGEVVPFIIR